MIRKHRAAFVYNFLAVSYFATAGYGAVPFAEDLSGCKLPNGVVTLPAQGTKAAADGDLLQLSTGRLRTVPISEEGRVVGPAQYAEKVRASGTADLQFVGTKPGALWAISGKISDLGSKYLSEAAALKPSAPLTMPATSRSPAGMFPGAVEGRTYLIQTSDEHYALVRILEKSEEALTVQYVYQPASTLDFEVPAADQVEYKRPGPPSSQAAERPPAVDEGVAPAPAATAAPRVVATLPPVPKLVPGPNDRVEPGIINLRSTPAESAGSATRDSSTAAPMGVIAPDANLAQFVRSRGQLVQSRIAIVQTVARTPAEIDRKAQAISDLVTLRADEAVDVLVSQIAFFNTRSTAREFSQEALHPCFAALKRLGKPASVAALKALRQINLDALGEGIDSPTYRAGLLAAVVREVEGKELADIIFKQEAAGALDSKHRAVFDYLLPPTP